MGGQVRFHIEQWQEITSDPNVLKCVKNCDLELEHEPASSFNRHTNAQNFSFSEQQPIDNELNEFSSKQIIEFLHHESGEVIYPIFILPKKEQGKTRVIFNLKKLNESVVYRKFKMDTLEAAIKLLKPHCYMTSIDRKYLKLSWRQGRI